MKSIDSRSLDDWYRAVNRIYLDQNFYRDTFSVFGHLVEILGGLTLLDTEKAKPGVDPYAFLPKAVAWWLALCGKFGVRSVEAMLWAKFPYVCPYCQLCPHQNDLCLERKAARRGPDWLALAQIGENGRARQPRTLGGWQRMFYDIYPTPNDPKYATPLMRFSEEAGELAEALRVASVAPGYFLSEASDVFAWLMNLQNVVQTKRRLAHDDRGKLLESMLSSAYPDMCLDCLRPVCICPPILPGTLGRIAHEIPPALTAFLPGGAVMSTDEAAAHFELGDRTISLGDRKIPTEAPLVREILRVVTELRFYAVENEKIAAARSGDLARAIAGVEALASGQRITQASIDRLADAIADLPPESRNALTSFLTGLGSSGWVAALLETVKSLIH